MSTRSMVTLAEAGMTPIHLYRHWDGYPAAAGATLAQQVRAWSRATWPSVPDLAARLLALRSHGSLGERPIYELANWEPSQQGDLEWIYSVHIPGRQDRVFPTAIRVRVEERSHWDGPWKRYTLSYSDFRAFCAKAARDMLGRIREYRARQLA